MLNLIYLKLLNNSVLAKVYFPEEEQWRQNRLKSQMYFAISSQGFFLVYVPPYSKPNTGASTLQLLTDKMNISNIRLTNVYVCLSRGSRCKSDFTTNVTNLVSKCCMTHCSTDFYDVFGPFAQQSTIPQRHVEYSKVNRKLCSLHFTQK